MKSYVMFYVGYEENWKIWTNLLKFGAHIHDIKLHNGIRSLPVTIQESAYNK